MKRGGAVAGNITTIIAIAIGRWGGVVWEEEPFECHILGSLAAHMAELIWQRTTVASYAMKIMLVEK